jgi:hypothetical protein
MHGQKLVRVNSVVKWLLLSLQPLHIHLAPACKLPSTLCIKKENNLRVKSVEERSKRCCLPFLRR